MEYDVDKLSEAEVIILQRLQEAWNNTAFDRRALPPEVELGDIDRLKNFGLLIETFGGWREITSTGRGYLRTLEAPAPASEPAAVDVDVDWIHIIVEQVRDKCKELLSVDDQIDTAWVLAKMDEIVEELAGE